MKFSKVVVKKPFFYTLFFLGLFGIFLYLVIKNSYLEQTKKELLDIANIVSLSKNFNNSLKIDNNLYIFISKDKKAKENEFNIIFSKELQKKIIYISKREIFKDEVVVIKVAKDFKELQKIVLTTFFKIFAAVILLVALIFYIFYKEALRSENELRNIIKFIKSFRKREKKITITSRHSREFREIAKLLSKVSKVLEKKEKQKAKYAKELQEANLSKDKTILVIAQRFKEIAATINGYSQIALEQKELSSSLQKNFLEKIEANSLKLLELLDTLRLAINLEKKKRRLNFKKEDIFNLTKSVAQELQESFFNREIKIKGEHKTLLIDKELFKIVLKNLIENALKYSNSEVEINITPTYLEVIDKGVGVKPKEIEKITQKFYRANNRWSNSLGLGLFIVKKILELHNFSFEIKSQDGFIFRIYFPKVYLLPKKSLSTHAPL